MDTILFGCAAAIVCFAAYAYRKRRRINHGLPHLDAVMRGVADEAQAREMADALAASVIERAKALKKTPLFVAACGDVYDDFFPTRQLPANTAPARCVNCILADCVTRYREARNNRSVNIGDFTAYALCAGAGLAVSSFRRLAECSSDMHDLAVFLAPAPEPDDWAAYREHYRDIGMLLDLPQARVEARLAKRREMFRVPPA